VASIIARSRPAIQYSYSVDLFEQQFFSRLAEIVEAGPKSKFKDPNPARKEGLCCPRSHFMNKRKLMIVWRNPDPARHTQRWQKLERRSGCSLYVIQELVAAGNRGYWATTSALEVLSGGRAVA
jgi:hypothetical protein